MTNALTRRPRQPTLRCRNAFPSSEARTCQQPEHDRDVQQIPHMSRAFVKEMDGTEGFDDLPDRPISPHPNLVTATGLAPIEAELAAARAAYAAAQAEGGVSADRTAMARATRDLRYWSARRAQRPAHRARGEAGAGAVRPHGGARARGRPPPDLPHRRRGRGRSGARAASPTSRRWPARCWARRSATWCRSANFWRLKSSHSNKAGPHGEPAWLPVGKAERRDGAALLAGFLSPLP